jgi:hypothetical protein
MPSFLHDSIVRLVHNRPGFAAEPVYRAALAARWRCPVALVVVCPEERIAVWANRVAAEIRADQSLVVLGPELVPRVDALPVEQRNPELAVLSVVIVLDPCPAPRLRLRLRLRLRSIYPLSP